MTRRRRHAYIQTLRATAHPNAAPTLGAVLPTEGPDEAASRRWLAIA